MYEFLSVYMTASSRDEADKIALALVEEKLAACVNIFPGILSVYKWAGTIRHSEECAMIAKIRSDQFDAFQKRVKELHSYECPCIVAVPVVAGSEEYLDWIRKETSGSSLK
ncbi:MAG: divalent-cation tolerance protein CutA [Bdellovibrionales bacterium]